MTTASGRPARQHRALHQDSGDLGAVKEQVVRPFKCETRRSETGDHRHGLVQGYASDEAESAARLPPRRDRRAGGWRSRLPGGDVQTRP